MKSLKKVLMAVLLVCGMVCGLNAGAATVRVEQSSKAAVLASFINAAMLNDSNAFLMCCSESLKRKFCAEASIDQQLEDLRTGAMQYIRFSKKGGKWYIECDENKTMTAQSKADRAAQAAVFARMCNAALKDDYAAAENCFSEHTRMMVRETCKAKGMGSEVFFRQRCMALKNAFLNGIHFVQKNGKWYVDSFDGM